METQRALFPADNFFPIGEAGQKKLFAARVLVVGCGATCSVITPTLARVGIGFIKITDSEFEKNLSLSFFAPSFSVPPN
jgi:tRNA A37 threonylcarbamoyladenosine dehydratase